MELKVWVEGIQRIVCGVTETTTCQDVVYALAHATGKTGRFTLIERWRNNERLLAPQEHPLKVLTKWGEYSNDVQFILQRSGENCAKGKPNPLISKRTTSPPPSPNEQPPLPPDRNKDIRKSLTFSGGGGVRETRKQDNLGLTCGIQQALEVKHSPPNDTASSPQFNCSSPSSEGTISPQHNMGLKREAPPYRDPPGPGHSQRALPPYRDPPPPPSTDLGKVKPKRSLLKDFESGGVEESVLYSSQYRDLVRLVNYQRDKLSSQQAELTKFDAEIVFWEGKTREQQHQMEFMSMEAAKAEANSKQNEEQIRQLVSVEEENEIVRQQEKTLKSELTLLRSKLANCETELLQCKNKIRLLIEELHSEERIAVRENDEQQQLERSLLIEVERLQRDVETAKQSTESAAHSAESLRKDVACLETAITEKKRQVERLVADMKEANLQSLAVASPEDNKMLLEGPHKPGSTRRMIGSPRQLENAVPTSKNPHGVWV
uniref:Ras-associating domain-containing protein n=1 Tax=Clastoptera arizonana TaxID=38151 RepID=A0A1B6ED01_9HEMI